MAKGSIIPQGSLTNTPTAPETFKEWRHRAGYYPQGTTWTSNRHARELFTRAQKAEARVVELEAENARLVKLNVMKSEELGHNLP